MRVTLEKIAILERSRLALVDIDCRIARRGLLSYCAPLLACGKACAAQAPQVGILECLEYLLARDEALDHIEQRFIAAGLTVLSIIYVVRYIRLRFPKRYRLQDLIGISVIN